MHEVVGGGAAVAEDTVYPEMRRAVGRVEVGLERDGDVVTLIVDC